MQFHLLQSTSTTLRTIKKNFCCISLYRNVLFFLFFFILNVALLHMLPYILLNVVLCSIAQISANMIDISILQNI